MEKNNASSLKIVRKFKASSEVIFDILTNPESMWVWWTEMTTFDIDLKVGGRWTILRKEGDAIYIALGEYLEVDKPNRVKYSYAMPQYSVNVDTISLDIVADSETSCTLTFEQVGKDIATELDELEEGKLSGSEIGWNQAFDLIARSLK